MARQAIPRRKEKLTYGVYNICSSISDNYNQTIEVWRELAEKGIVYTLPLSTTVKVIVQGGIFSWNMSMSLQELREWGQYLVDVADDAERTDR